MSSALNAGEARRAARRRVLRSGRLAYGDNMSAECSIRDESPTGARVSVGAYLLPRDVVLVYVSNGVAYESKVVWRRGADAGLCFVKQHVLERPPAAPSTPLGVAKRLWRFSNNS